MHSTSLHFAHRNDLQHPQRLQVVKHKIQNKPKKNTCKIYFVATMKLEKINLELQCELITMEDLWFHGALAINEVSNDISYKHWRHIAIGDYNLLQTKPCRKWTTQTSTISPLMTSINKEERSLEIEAMKHFGNDKHKQGGDELGDRNNETFWRWQA